MNPGNGFIRNKIEYSNLIKKTTKSNDFIDIFHVHVTQRSHLIMIQYFISE